MDRVAIADEVAVVVYVLKRFFDVEGGCGDAEVTIQLGLESQFDLF